MRKMKLISDMVVKNGRTPAVVQLLLCYAGVRQLCVSTVYSGAKRFSQLIGAGGILETALNSLNLADAFFHVHAFYKASDTFQISVAAAFIGDIADFTVLNVKCDLS